MFNRNHHFLAAMIVASIATAATATGQTQDPIRVPPVPSNLQVPSGNVPFVKGFATGTQNYICRTTETGLAWTLFGPQATLFLKFNWLGGEVRQQIMTHFLSMNPQENGLPRATWQSSLDTSAVWGKAIANSSDPNYVAAGAIPWLLLEIVGTERGPSGGSLLAPTTYIQRVNTSAGVAPATGCSQQSDVGSTVLVPYKTDYFFYRASRR